jgi:hypothetical protein
MKSNLGAFNAKLWTEDIFKPTTGNDSLNEDNNDNDIKVVKYNAWLIKVIL